MENKKLDQLFREKLAQHELQPSSESWKLVNDQIQSKTRPMVWMRVAAAVTVLAIATFVLWEQEVAGVPGGHLADAPIAQAEAPSEWPELNFESKKVAVKAPTQGRVKKVSNAFDNRQVAEVFNEEKTLEMPVALETIKPNITEPILVKSTLLPNQTLMAPEVEMTYLAGVEPIEDDKKGIEKIWAKAKDMSPGELWGSLRDTKNQLLSLNRN